LYTVFHLFVRTPAPVAGFKPMNTPHTAFHLFVHDLAPSAGFKPVNKLHAALYLFARDPALAICRLASVTAHTAIPPVLNPHR
jgi:hypothetical protein